MSDFWNERFAGEEYRFGTDPAAFLAREAGRLAAGSRVLCVADGEGRNSVHLARMGHEVTAFDAAEAGIAKARRLAKREGVSVDFNLATVEEWDWSGNYDAVVAIFIQFAGPDMRAEIFDGIARALRSGGLLLLHGYAPRQVEYRTGGPGVVENLYTLEMLREAFDGWEVLVARDYDAEISEGSGHVGRSALIDFVARKP